MYIFITKEQRASGDIRYINKEKMCLEIINTRNKLVKVIKDYRKGMTILNQNSCLDSMTLIQSELSNVRLSVSYLNYILDTYRINIDKDKTKPARIKSLDRTNYSYIDSLSTVLDYITGLIWKYELNGVDLGK